MNKFKDSLKIVQALENTYKQHGTIFEFKDKVALAVYYAMIDIQPKNKQEELQKQEYIVALNKFICNFEELEPVISQYLHEKTEYTPSDSMR